MPCAARIRVPISRTKTDIEELLARHGATGFAYALSWQTSVQSLPSRGYRGLRSGAGEVPDIIVADFRRKSAIFRQARLMWHRRDAIIGFASQLKTAAVCRAY